MPIDRAAAIVTACLSLFGLAACGMDGSQHLEYSRESVTRVVRQPVELAVPLAPGGTIPARHRPVVATLLDAWRDRGRGPLFVAVPTTAVAAQERLLADLRHLAGHRGADPGAIQLVEAAAGQTDAVLRFENFVALGPECPPELGALDRPKNMPAPAFGCATQRNLAALVAHPADLFDPLPLGNANAGRQSLVVQRYRLGKPTSSPGGEQDSANVSSMSK